MNSSGNVLKGFDSVFKTTLNNEIQDNLIEFFDWGLLQKGNYFNVTLGETDLNGNDYSKLSYVDLDYVDGLVFQGFRSNWVWQSGIDYSPSPIVATGVSIDGEMSGPSESGREYKVDYFNGRVIFTSESGVNNPNGVNENTEVKIEHSYKYINVIYANNLPWLKEIQYRSLYNSDSDPSKLVPNETKIQLPAIAIELVPNRYMRGYQLGGGQYIYTDILFHCIAENDFEMNKLVDIVSLQNDKTIHIFNSNKIADSGAFPIKYDGTLSSNPLSYPQLIDDYSYSLLRLQNCSAQPSQTINSNLHVCVVKFNSEIIKNDV